MENNKSIMNFRKFIQYFNRTNESNFKENRLNQILDKMNQGEKLSPNEQKFLNDFTTINDDEYKDYRMLSSDTTFTKIVDLLEIGKKVICNLCDRDGKIGLPIKSIYNNYEREKIFIKLTNNEEVELKDNFFYDLKFNINNDNYSLEELDEYHEKIPVKND